MNICRNIITIGVIAVVTAAGFIVAAYAVLHAIVIPRVVIPRANEMLSSLIPPTVTISSLRLSPRGRIIIGGVMVTAQTGALRGLRVEQIRVTPRYRDIISSRLRREEPFRAPLSLTISGIDADVPPLTVAGSIDADLTLLLGRAETTPPDVRGTVNLSNFVLRDIPFFGDLTALSGSIAVSSQRIESTNVQGMLQGKPLTLTFSLSDLAQPKVSAELLFDQLRARADAQSADDRIEIVRCDVVFRESTFGVTGSIDDISGAPTAALHAQALLRLSDLQFLPSVHLATLQALRPTGAITASLSLQGPLSDPLRVNANAHMESQSIRAGPYSAQDISLKAALREGELHVDQGHARVLDFPVEVAGSLSFSESDMPFAATLNAGPGELASLRAVLPKEAAIDGQLTAGVSVHGTLTKAPENIAAQITTLWRRGSFAGQNLPPEITAEARLKMTDALSLVVETLTIKDGITSLRARGSITHVPELFIDMRAEATTDLSQLGTYPFPEAEKLPPLAGAPTLSVRWQAAAAQWEEQALPFTLHADSLTYDTISFEDLSARGSISSSRAAVDELNARMFGGTLSAAARVAFADPSRAPLSLSLRAEQMDMTRLSSALPQLAVPLEGVVSASLFFDGHGIVPEDCAGKGSLEVRWLDGRMRGKDLDEAVIHLDAELDRGTITIPDVSLRYGKLALSGQCTYLNIFTAPQLSATITSSVALEELSLLPIDMPPAVTELALTGLLTAHAQVTGPLRPQTIATEWPLLTFSGALRSDAFSVHHTVWENMELTAEFTANLLSLHGRVDSYGGTVDLVSNVDVSQSEASHTHRVTIADVDIGALLAQSELLEQAHQGIVSLAAEISGRGADASALLGSGTVSLTHARLAGLELLNAIGRLLRLPWMEDFTVTQATATIQVKDAAAHTEDLQLFGPQASLQVRGSVDFDQHLDLLVRLTLSPEAVARSSRAVLENAFMAKDEKYFTELAVRGTLQTPQPDVTRFVQERIRQRAKTEMKDLLQGEGKKLLEGLFKK